MKNTSTKTARLMKSTFVGFRERYTSPCIKSIQIDNDISLALESTPPAGPEEGMNSLHNPFKLETDFV